MNDFFINENYSAQLFIHPVNINYQTEGIADIITPYKITGSAGSGYKISTKIKMNLQNFFTIYGGYRLKIENEYAAFSYLDLNLGFSINQIKYDTPNEFNFYELKAARPGEYIDAAGIMRRESGLSYSLLAKLTIPFFYLNKNFYFKIGGIYEFRSNNFSYNTEIRETITDLKQNSTLTVHKTSGSYNNITHIGIGLISFNSSVTDKIDIVLEGTYSTKIGMSVGLVYNF